MENLTSESEILETVLGQRIEFTLTPVQVTPPPQPTWSKTEEEFLGMEIQRLLLKGVVVHTQCLKRANLFPPYLCAQRRMDPIA